MTIGDVLATIAGVVAICVSFWAALVFTSLLFPERARDASAEIEKNPMRCIGAGLVLGGVAELVALVLVNQPNGLLKLIGWVCLAALACLVTLGASGLSLFAAKRIRAADERRSPFVATAEGAGLLVASGVIPFLGWIVFGGCILASLGAAVLTLNRQRHAATLASVAVAGATPAPSPAGPSPYDVE